MGRAGGNWIDVKPRRRKALRQEDRGLDRQREALWSDGRYGFGFRRSRFRFAVRDGGFLRERSWDSSPVEKACYTRSRHPSREDGVAFRRRVGRRLSRPRNLKEVVASRAVAAGFFERTREVVCERKDGAVSPLNRFVTFYFTNFPMLAPNFILRKGFEVCGMLEEVFVPNKLNINDEAYGFVRFSNVCDIDKLLRAVNDVHFGTMRVKASLARFHKSN